VRSLHRIDKPRYRKMTSPIACIICDKTEGHIQPIFQGQVECGIRDDGTLEYEPDFEYTLYLCSKCLTELEYCPICMDERLAKNHILIDIQCGCQEKMFHLDCILKWQKEGKSSCPCCRQDFFLDVQVEDEGEDPEMCYVCLEKPVDTNFLCAYGECYCEELLCSDCIEYDDFESFHESCLPIDWALSDAFQKFGFADGNSHRNYTYVVRDELEDKGYTVEADSWGSHNYVIMKITDELGNVLYGGDEWRLSGYYDDARFVNVLPARICAILWNLQVQIDEDNREHSVGFELLPWDYFFY
jgi:hypothetical protein